MVPNLGWFDLGFFSFTMVESDTHSVETILRMLIFLRLMIYSIILTHDAGQQQQAAAPSAT